MATYPLPTLAATVDASGISAPSYNDILQSLIAIFQGIYGSSIYIQPDSQDGQWLAAMASAINDCNQAAVAVFQGFSPTYAQGAGLSLLLKLNGLTRNIPSYSTSQGNVVGVAGTVITNGIVQDGNGNQWALPASVTIPVGGLISVTVTAVKSGNISAALGTINSIFTPQFGWQSFISTVDSTVGAAVETDPEARARQAISTALPALGPKEAISAAIGNVTGVIRWMVYENDTGTTDTNGIPAHSISAVTEGGSSADIAAAVASKKMTGAQTYGSTPVAVYDQYGLPTTINYFILTLIPIYFAITIKALPGYVSTTGVAIQNTLAAFVNSLAIGGDVYEAQTAASASLINLGIGQTFKITIFNLGFSAAPTGTADLTILFNQAASCNPANVALTVT
jgi:uncharacterized phage protein gp47/JayE